MRYILCAAALIFAVVLLTEPTAVGGAVQNAVTTCLEVMIPSLFAFTVLSVYLQASGLYRSVFRFITFPLSKLMRLDEELCAVFLLSNIGGYPVGARLLTELVKCGRISSSDAGRLLCCCYGSGPSFVIGIAGMRVFGSTAAGAVLFMAGLLSSLAIGIFVCRTGNRIKLIPAVTNYDPGAGCFVGSVMSAARVMFTVCVMITGFAAVTAVLDALSIQRAAEIFFAAIGTKENSSAILPSLLEISCLQNMMPSGWYIFPLCGALLSFGGVCVIMQICALTEGKIPLKGFLLSRLPAAVISAIASTAGLLLGEPVLSAYAPSAVEVQPFSVNAVMSLCVLTMCGMLLACKPRYNAQ